MMVDVGLDWVVPRSLIVSKKWPCRMSLSLRKIALSLVDNDE